MNLRFMIAKSMFLRGHLHYSGMLNSKLMKTIICTWVLLLFLVSCSKNDDQTNNNPGVPPDSVTDIDGNVYHVIKIGTQYWMKENLRVTRLNDGTILPDITSDPAWNWSVNPVPAYCWFANDSARYSNDLGALYNWYAVATARLAPAGWHVPSDADWQTLVDYLGEDSVVGGMMKETGIEHWNDPNVGATNSSGFTARGSGWRPGTWQELYKYAFFWSSTEYDSLFAYTRELRYDKATIRQYHWAKRWGLSVRCIWN
jgi:uncharacterized protein (TIGR02145 family)